MTEPATAATKITCPRCGRTSHNPNDVAELYCGHCHWWTSDPVLGPLGPSPASSAERVCAKCGAAAVVGFGEKPRWLCQVHFDEAMARVGQILRLVRAATEDFYA